MKKLFLFLIVGLLLLPLTASLNFVEARADITTEEIDVTVATFFDASNVIEPVVQPQNYGATLAFTPPGDASEYDFAFWIVNGFVSDEYLETAEFTVTSKLDLVAVYYPVGKHAVLFVDSNGKVIDYEYVNNAAVVTPPAELPNKPGYTLATGEAQWALVKGAGDLSGVTASSVYQLQYVLESTEAFAISVTGGTVSNATPNYNEIVTVTATLPGFTHWEEDGVVVSYDAEYKFSALYDRNLEAKTEGTPAPLVTLSADLEVRDGYHTYAGQFYLPEGYTLVEHGFLFKDSTETLTLETPGVTIAKSNTYQPTTNEFITSFPVGILQSVRTYSVVKQGSTVSTIYSEMSNKYLEELVYSFNFTTTTITNSYADTTVSRTIQNLVTDSNVTVNRFRVAANTVTNYISGDRALILSGSTKDSSLEAHIEFDFEISTAYKITFDAFAWSLDDYNDAEEILLQVKNSEGYWDTAINLKPLIEFATPTNPVNLTFVGLWGREFRLYVEGNQSTNNNGARIIFDNFKVYTIFKGETHEILYSIDDVITTTLAKDGHLLNEPADPIKSGYHFDGWYLENTFVTLYEFNDTITAEFTLYAKWVPTFNIVFDSKGGSIVESQVVISNNQATEPSIPTRYGFNFDGWYLDDGTFLYEFTFSDPITEDLVLYAKWEEIEGTPEPIETLLYTTGWEDGTNSNSYPGTRDLISNGVTWTFTRGNIVSTGTPISGTFDAMFRIPSGVSGEGELYMKNDFSNKEITKIKFKANMSNQASTDKQLKIYYKLSTGDWVLYQTLQPPNPNSSQEYEIFFTGVSGIVNVKFEFSYTGNATANRDSRIDDIEIHGYDFSE